MNSRNSRKRGLWLILPVSLAACLAVLVYEQRPAQAPSPDTVIESLPVKKPAPEAVEFRMTDFENGWLRYSDGKTKVTNDGGAVWRDEASDLPVQTLSGGGAGGAAPVRGEWSLAPAEEPKPATILYEAKSYPVKQSQFLTDRIGWALLDSGSGLALPLLVTTDGGETWRGEVTADVREAVQAEKKREAQAAQEAALYETPEQARLAIRSKWTLLPDQAFVGDIVLVRHDKPGEVSWQGKTYKLQPFGSGYYTYLPISMQVKPGEYPIGGLTLTVKDKKFQTQYLQVSQQMESMRQDTDRIQADQKKIDAARSKSEPEFLFSSAFIQPIQGILTTPYGYTRYVNGKWDSSHTALDLAAKEGTPIKATNDGIVALADSLYLTGNAIYLDHGMGLFSQYAHLSELRVKTGDRVKKGDIIGLVGTTGFSTGPHLHFTFWAHNVPTNPNLFFDTMPFRWVRQAK
ncbi:M23 family peptidase [Paenibacillus mesophilus]|uniref:M23 family metallopeptidase n=1 Tax=Paenibacillus mesophilus TaxID=2582849 RepID=UPI00110EDC14|nr:peptidoglycan DD-metalloendopeptidase family protein [Paenibacillus mesophilus]TMV49501.1 M23 family peptidase [Paenibacillus mesophilus]